MTDQPPPTEPTLFRDPDKIVSDLRLLGKCTAFGVPAEMKNAALGHIARIFLGQPIADGADPPREREVRAAIGALLAMKRHDLDLAKAEAGLDLDRLKDRIAIALQVNVNTGADASLDEFREALQHGLDDAHARLARLQRTEPAGDGDGGDPTGHDPGHPPTPGGSDTAGAS